MEPRNEEKKSRFQIEPLEERIAPSALGGFNSGKGHGQCHKDLGQSPGSASGPSAHSSLAADIDGNCPS